VLILISLACSSTGTPSDGSVQFFDEQGISFAAPKGMIVTNFLGPSVEAQKTDRSPEDNMLGPLCVASTYEHRDFTLDKNNQWVVRVSGINNNFGLTVTDPMETTLNGETALVADVSGSFIASYDSNLTAAYGKLLMASIKEKRIFDMFCFGPATRKTETLSIFDAILGSVQFYDPIVPTKAP
jgi:hypothetical protein